MKVKIHNRKSFNYLIIIIFGLVLGIPLFSKNLNIYWGNGFFELAKGFEFTKNISINEGKILTSFFNYIGTGNTILESPLSTLLIFIGNYILDSYILTYKVIVFCSILLSGLYMHKFSDKVTQNKDIALLSSLLYMCAPLHLGQIYVSNSLDNILIFIFIPMTFFGLYKMFNTTEHSFHVAFGIIGLILTDLTMAVIISVAIIIYSIINFKNWPVEHVRKYIVINFIAIISITAFFVFPYIQANLMTEYVGSSISKQEFLDSRVGLKSLFVTEENSNIILEFGPHIIIMLSFSLMAFRKLKDDDKKEFVFCFTMMLLYIIFSTKIFPWNIFPNWIIKIEEPYKFLIIAVFFECFICAVNMNTVLKKFSVRDVIIISTISLIYVLALKGFIPYTENIEEIDNYNISDEVDYKVLPKKAKLNIDYIKNRSRDVEIIKGTAEIYDKNKFLTYYNFKADTLEKGTVYELPFLYYPGYEIRYDGITIDYFESEHGLIAIEMDPELGTYYEVNYVGTDLMNFCKILSFTGLCAFCIYVYKKH